MSGIVTQTVFSLTLNANSSQENGSGSGIFTTRDMAFQPPLESHFPSALSLLPQNRGIPLLTPIGNSCAMRSMVRCAVASAILANARPPHFSATGSSR
jgi:hypothetical protein